MLKNAADQVHGKLSPSRSSSSSLTCCGPLQCFRRLGSPEGSVGQEGPCCQPALALESALDPAACSAGSAFIASHKVSLGAASTGIPGPAALLLPDPCTEFKSLFFQARLA